MSRGLLTMLSWGLLCCCLPVWVLGATNNKLNADNTITWGDLAPDQPYKTVGYEANDGGLDPYFNLAKSFIDSSLPSELPIATAKGIVDGTVNIKDEWQGIAKQFVGFSICLVLGLLFIIIFPIVGCCFCCCRCCGNCGGKRIQKPDDRAKCKRYVFSAILFVLALFVVAGAACTFVSSDQIHKNLGGLASTVQDSVDDAQTFVDNIHTQFTQLGDTNFNILKNKLTDFVTGASVELSDRLITKLNDLVNLTPPLNTISSLKEKAVKDIDDLENKIKTLENQKAAAAQNSIIQGHLAGFDISSMKSKVDDFRNKAETDVFDKIKSDLDDAIKQKVDESTRDINVSTELNKIQNDQIRPMLRQLENLRSSARDDLQKYSDKIDDFTRLIIPYDQYRWYAGVGLASFLLLIAVLMLVGVLMGALCGSANDKPTERGGASNCAGIMLMASVGLVFIFGALLMLLTTLMYVFGSVTERYVCQGLDDLTKIEEYTAQFSLGFDLKNISFDLNGNPIHTSVSSMMDGCKQGKTLYSVLNLHDVVEQSLDKIDQFRTTFDITNKLNASVVFSSLQGPNQIDVAAQIGALRDTATAATNIKTTITSMETQLENLRTSLGLAGQTISPMITTLNEMIIIVDDMKKTADDIATKAADVDNAVTLAKTRLQDSNITIPLIRNVTQAFVVSLFAFVDSYIADVKSKLATSVGKCTPVYSIFTAVFSEAFCHGIIDPLNGFWLALGWCIFFFMPGLIFSVKLAKHFRQMMQEDSYSDPKQERAKGWETHEMVGSGTPNRLTTAVVHSNKVSPLDF